MNEETENELLSLIKESHYWGLVDDVATMFADKEGRHFFVHVYERMLEIWDERDKKP